MHCGPRILWPISPRILRPISPPLSSHPDFAVRPALHKCEEQAATRSREGGAARASATPTKATFTLSIAADGRVTKAHVDPWTGDRDLLTCAARALEGARFTPPPNSDASKAKSGADADDERGAVVIARLHFTK